MLSPSLRLVLALALTVSSVTFLAVTLNAANTREIAPATVTPLKAKILRRKDKMNDKLSAEELAELRRQAAQESTRGARTRGHNAKARADKSADQEREGTSVQRLEKRALGS